MSLFAIIDYSLVIIFFIGITCLLILFTRSSQQATTPANLPLLREEPATYAFLAALFLLFVVLTAFAQKKRG